MESRVHLISVLGEEGEYRGTILDFERADFFFNFNATGNFIVEAFPNQRRGDLLLKFVFVGIGVIKNLLVQITVPRVDVNFMANKIVADDSIYTDAVGYA